MVLTVGMTLAMLSLPLPQGGDGSQHPPLLTVAEQKSLNKKLADWIEARRAWDEAAPNKRESASKKHEKAKEAFVKEWEARNDKAKVDLLKSIPDLRAIFDNCLPYDRMTGSGSIRKEELRDPRAVEKAYALFVPKSYKAEVPHRSVLLVPGRDAAEAWVESRAWFAQTWDGAGLLADTVFNVVQVPKEFELDPIPDFSREGDDAKETRCIALMLVSLGVTGRTYNLDRDRMFLDCGRGSSGFGLRLASMFPDRFAGIVLRHAPDVDGIRLGSLTGIPVLIVADAQTAAAAAKLQQRLNDLQAGACTVVNATDAYPFKAATAEVEKWMTPLKRNLMRTKVVLEPNHPRFTKGYWVSIESMENIAGVPLDKRGRIEVEADRKQNRVTVKAVGVDTFTLLLNDDMVDLDDPKGVTVIVNDKAVTKKRGRDFQRVFDLVCGPKLDTGWLFPATFDCQVPKAEPKPGETPGK